MLHTLPLSLSLFLSYTFTLKLKLKLLIAFKCSYKNDNNKTVLTAKYEKSVTWTRNKQVENSFIELKNSINLDFSLYLPVIKSTTIYKIQISYWIKLTIPSSFHRWFFLLVLIVLSKYLLSSYSYSLDKRTKTEKANEGKKKLFNLHLWMNESKLQLETAG